MGRECRTTRALGSAALGLSYLAAGWIDVYFHPMLAPWDGAAGQVMVEEAGAGLFNFAGTRWNYTEPDCIACTPQLIEWARRFISDEIRFRFLLPLDIDFWMCYTPLQYIMMGVVAEPRDPEEQRANLRVLLPRL